jgi:hypothetical protein
MYRYVFFRSESGLIFYWKQQALPLRQPCAVRPCAFSQRGDFLRGLTVCEKHGTGRETYSIFFEEIPAKKYQDVPEWFARRAEAVNGNNLIVSITFSPLTSWSIRDKLKVWSI